MRLDIRAEAVAAVAFVPGKPDESQLVERIFSTDADVMMPPASSNKRLTAQEKEIIHDTGGWRPIKNFSGSGLGRTLVRERHGAADL
jgi:hypothetical protein